MPVNVLGYTGTKGMPAAASLTSMGNIAGAVDAEKLETCLYMLRANLDSPELEPLIAALEALKQSPRDQARLARVEAAFNKLTILQGAVLTYAPYMSVLLSSDPFGDD